MYRNFCYITGYPIRTGDVIDRPVSRVLLRHTVLICHFLLSSLLSGSVSQTFMPIRLYYGLALHFTTFSRANVTLALVIGIGQGIFHCNIFLHSLRNLNQNEGARVVSYIGLKSGGRYISHRTEAQKSRIIMQFLCNTTTTYLTAVTINPYQNLQNIYLTYISL